MESSCRNPFTHFKFIQQAYISRKLDFFQFRSETKMFTKFLVFFDASAVTLHVVQVQFNEYFDIFDRYEFE